MAQVDGKIKRQQVDIKSSPGGRYVRSDETLGKGEFKRVFLATDTESARDVAWNVVDFERLREDEQSAVRKETEILSKLSHKNVMDFFYMWEEKEHGQLIFITERLSSTLKKYIKRIIPVKLHILQRWCRQILGALDYLHTQEPPVIHRDLKCDNILVDGGGKGDLKLADFGLSISRVEKSKTMLGTPGFMAWEMFEKEPQYNFKIDIYAFGMCVLEMVTDEYPYAAECDRLPNIIEKTQKHEPPQALSRVKDKTVKDLIEQCLKPAAERPTASELMQHKFFRKQFSRDIAAQRESKNIHLSVEDVKQDSDDDGRYGGEGQQGDRPSEKEGRPPNYPVTKVKAERSSDSSWNIVNLTIVMSGKKFSTPFNFEEDTSHSIAQELFGTDGEEDQDIQKFVLLLAQDIKTKLYSYREKWIEAQNKDKDDAIQKLLLQLGINTDYSERFSAEELSVDDIRMLSDDQIRKLIPKMGPRMRLQNWVEDERKADPSNSSSASTPAHSEHAQPLQPPLQPPSGAGLMFTGGGGGQYGSLPMPLHFSNGTSAYVAAPSSSSGGGPVSGVMNPGIAMTPANAAQYGSSILGPQSAPNLPLNREISIQDQLHYYNQLIKYQNAAGGSSVPGPGQPSGGGAPAGASTATDVPPNTPHPDDPQSSAHAQASQQQADIQAQIDRLRHLQLQAQLHQAQLAAGAGTMPSSSAAYVSGVLQTKSQVNPGALASNPASPNAQFQKNS